MRPTEDQMDALNDTIRSLRSELERGTRVAADYFDTITALREAGWRVTKAPVSDGFGNTSDKLLDAINGLERVLRTTLEGGGREAPLLF